MGAHQADVGGAASWGGEGRRRGPPFAGSGTLGPQKTGQFLAALLFIDFVRMHNQRLVWPALRHLHSELVMKQSGLSTAC